MLEEASHGLGFGATGHQHLNSEVQVEEGRFIPLRRRSRHEATVRIAEAERLRRNTEIRASHVCCGLVGIDLVDVVLDAFDVELR